MPAEVGLAAFHRLQKRNLLDGSSTPTEIESALREPLEVGGRALRYRYPVMKARFVAAAMERLNVEQPPTGAGKAVRDWLMGFDGIGPKTASWITRNTLGCDEVAILDIHVVRAGLLMGLFSGNERVEKNYFDMEAKLIEFTKAAELRLSTFDSIIWYYMRELSQFARCAVSSIALRREWV
jgi:thermostable 8-oxoguanine DNA glycosylase